MKVTRSNKFMQFFGPPDEGGGATVQAPAEDNFYEQTSNDAVPDDVVEDITGKLSEDGGELDESQDTDQHITNRQEGSVTKGDESTQIAPDGTADKTAIEDDKFTKLVETLTDRLAPQPQTNKEELSEADQQRLQQELNDWIKPVNVTKKDLEGLGFEDPTDEQVAVLQNIQKAGVQNAVRVAQIAMQQMIQPLQQQVEHMGHHVSDQQQAKAVDAFYTKHTELKGKDKVVTMIANQVGADESWLQGKSFDQISDRVAKETNEFLRGLGVPVEQGQTNEASANLSAGSSNDAVPQMQTLSGSGRSSGRGGSVNNKVSDDEDVYNT